MIRWFKDKYKKFSYNKNTMELKVKHENLEKKVKVQEDLKNKLIKEK